MQVRINENGKAYFVVLDNGSATPTAYQVRSGQDSNGAAVPSNRKGSIALSEDYTETETITRLEALNNYVLYVVAEDSIPNLQDSPVEIQLSTILPAFVGAETNADGTEVWVTFNKKMDDPDGEDEQFTVW